MTREMRITTAPASARSIETDPGSSSPEHRSAMSPSDPRPGILPPHSVPGMTYASTTPKIGVDAWRHHPLHEKGEHDGGSQDRSRAVSRPRHAEWLPGYLGV